MIGAGGASAASGAGRGMSVGSWAKDVPANTAATAKVTMICRVIASSLLKQRSEVCRVGRVFEAHHARSNRRVLRTTDFCKNDRRDEVPDFPLLQKRALVPPARLSCPAYR